jgi:hypothetical protein
MKRVRVRSSELRSVGYDPLAVVLEVEFVAGGVYQYSGVSAETVLALLEAESIGRYFNAHVRGRYDYRKVD